MLSIFVYHVHSFCALYMVCRGHTHTTRHTRAHTLVVGVLEGGESTSPANWASWVQYLSTLDIAANPEPRAALEAALRFRQTLPLPSLSAAAA